MTIIQPNRTQAFPLNLIIGALIVLVMLSAVWLVSLYNTLVNIQHGISETKDEIKQIQTANAELKEELFALLDSRKFEEFAAEAALIKDRAPRYFQLDPQWSLASHF